MLEQVAKPSFHGALPHPAHTLTWRGALAVPGPAARRIKSRVHELLVVGAGDVAGLVGTSLAIVVAGAVVLHARPVRRRPVLAKRQGLIRSVTLCIPLGLIREAIDLRLVRPESENSGGDATLFNKDVVETRGVTRGRHHLTQGQVLVTQASQQALDQFGQM